MIMMYCGIAERRGRVHGCACAVGLASAVQGACIGCAFVCCACWPQGWGAAGCRCGCCHYAWVAMGVCSAVADFWRSLGRPGGVLCLGVGALAYGPGGLHTRGSWLELGRRLAGRLRIPTQLGGDGHLGGRGGAMLLQQPDVEHRTPRALSPLICDLRTAGRLADRCGNT